MDLGEAIYREICGRSPHTEIGGGQGSGVSSFGQAIDYLLWRAAGSASAAARIIGVPPSSMRHWVSSGRRPKAQRAAGIAGIALRQQRRDRLSAGRERQLRRPGALDSIRMVGALTYDSAPEPERDVDLGSYMDEIQNDLIDAFLDGASLDELADIFCEGVNDPFYHDTLDPGSESRMSWDIVSLDGWR